MINLTLSLAFLILINFSPDNNFKDRYLASKRSIQKVRITSIDVYDQGTYSSEATGNPQIDTTQGICLGDPSDNSDDTDEPFYESIIGIEVLNDTKVDVNFSKVWFKIPRVDGTKRSFTSLKLAPIMIAEIKPAERKKIFSFLLKTSGTSKLIPGKTSDQGITSGFRTVTVYLKGRDSNGKKYQIKAKTTISFNNYDRCAS